MKRVGLFSVLMIVIIGIIIFLSFIFPVKKAFQSKNDRLLENNLQSIKYDIDNYYDDNKKLPESLSDIDVDGEDAKAIIDKNLVEYKVISNKAQRSQTSRYSSSQTIYEGRYELCVEYTFEKDSKYANDYIDSDEEYSSSLYAYYHPAGKVCYKLSTY